MANKNRRKSFNFLKCFAVVCTIAVVLNFYLFVNSGISSLNRLKKDGTAKETLEELNSGDQQSLTVAGWYQKRKKLLLTPGNPRKVVLFAYMRTGSSLSFEMFRKNSQAMALYEPFDAFFMEYFGLMPYWNLPTATFFNQTDSGEYVLRHYSDWEINKAGEFSHNILNCQFSKFPQALLSHQGITQRNFMSGAGGLRTCLKNTEKQFKENQNFAADYDIARTIEYSMCGKDLLRAKESFCCERLRNANAMLNSMPLPFPNVPMEPLVVTVKEDNVSATKVLDFKKWVLHRRAHGEVIFQTCYQKMEEECQKKKLIAYKVLRLSMVEVEELLQRDPDLFIFYLTRDPRKIVDSLLRKKFLSDYSLKKPVLEAKLLCTKMEKDLRIFHKLKKKYNEALTHITYEEMSMDIQSLTEKIYNKIGLTLSQGVKDNLSRRLKKKSKKSIGAEEEDKITAQCRTVLKILNFTLDS